MRLSGFSCLFFICIVIFAIFVANVTNLINNLTSSSQEANSLNDVRWRERKRTLQIDDSSQHLMWFVQVSDIHISIFSDPERIKQFHEFTSKTLDIIRPDVVIASGDLTDGRDNDFFGSRQFRSEWEAYRKAIDDSRILNKTMWLDIRGNHDNFNVAGAESDKNYFREYSVQGKVHRRSYMKQVQKGNEKYTFIAVDACLNPGPKRPFNFIGVLSQNDTNHLNDLANEARRNGGNYTIWFGHYPTSCIITAADSGSSSLRRLIGQHDESLVYLCGHLHNFGGMVPNMFSLQNDGFLELELGDWRKFRWFRLGVIDHGLFSFVDTHHNEWPLVLVTNPKNYLFNIPHREHPNLQLGSTHIRILAFSTSPINNCSIRINGESWQKCVKVNENLFVVKWNPHSYSKGVHELHVDVIDDDGKQRLLSQSFSLDGTTAQFDGLARLTLMNDATAILKTFFGFAVSCCVVPLVLFRLCHVLTNVGWLTKPRITCSFLNKIIRRFWILSTINRIFFPIVLYCLYLTVGPWSILEVVDGHTGFVFFHGIYLNGGYIFNALSCIYGFFQLTLCQMPLNFIFSTLINERYCQFVGIPRNTASTSLSRKIRHAPFFTIIGVEVVLAIIFWKDYGFVAFLLSPFRTWSVVMNVILWHQAKNIPDACLRSAAMVWNKSKLSYEGSTSRDL